MQSVLLSLKDFLILYLDFISFTKLSTGLSAESSKDEVNLGNFMKRKGKLFFSETHAIKITCIWQRNILKLFKNKFQKYLTFL